MQHNNKSVYEVRKTIYGCDCCILHEFDYKQVHSTWSTVQGLCTPERANKISTEL